MKRKRVLSVFVDESGRFKYPDPESHYYIVGLVFHDQAVDIAPLVRKMDQKADELGLDTDVFAFHAGPIIRQEKGYEIMNRRLRGRIFDRMMNFARRVDFKYHCVDVDKRYVTSVLQIATRLKRGLEDFLAQKKDALDDVEKVKIYYDCGQAPVTNLLHQTFSAAVPCPVEFAQGVKPGNYKLFQVADLICTLHLIELKIRNGEPMTHSEFKFFGSPRTFEHNVLRKIKSKEI